MTRGPIQRIAGSEYLRRIPDLLVEERVGTTLSYTLGIAKALTDRADGNSAPILRDDWISFKVDEHVTRHVLTLVCRTRFIFTAHSLIRTVGKGCDLRFDAEGIPHADCTDGLRQSMMLFDDRMARSQELLSRAGSPLPMTPAWEETDRALLACFRKEPQLVEAPFPVEGVSDPRIRAQFKPMFVSVEHLKEFNTGFGGQQWWQPEAVTLTLFLALSAHLLFELPNAAGGADTQFFLGVTYASGFFGVPKDYAQAAQWFRKAAEQGHADAQAFLGVMYSNGEGVPEDDVQAVQWWRKAAEQGYATAEYSLGWMYGNGRGVPQDYLEAHKWLNLAAARAKGKRQVEVRRGWH